MSGVDWYGGAKKILTEYNSDRPEAPYDESNNSAVSAAAAAQAMATLALVDAIRELAPLLRGPEAGPDPWPGVRSLATGSGGS